MEREFKHTPGPWEVIEYDNKSDDGKSFMGKISTREGYSIYSAFGFQSMTGRNEKEARANAKLIAASPTMLQTLERIANCNDLATAQEYAREAINKATS